MTNEITDYEVEHMLDDDKDIDALCEQEYIKDLHMRHDYYIELIEEFED